MRDRPFHSQVRLDRVARDDFGDQFNAETGPAGTAILAIRRLDRIADDRFRAAGSPLQSNSTISG